MKIHLIDNLPFIDIVLQHRDSSAAIHQVLIDTGSATTILSANNVSKVGIHPEVQDPIIVIRGIGGSEVVYTRQIEKLTVGSKSVVNFPIEIGAMDYGFDIHGILGMDFLVQTRAIINLGSGELEFG